MTVQIRYKGVEKTFSGNAEEAWLFTKRFFLELIPSFEIANKLLLKADLQKLAKDCENIIAFSQEGPNVLVPRNKLTDNETLSLWLLANYLGSQLGILKNDTASKEELQARLGKGAKITSTRLGELVKTDIAARTADERYRITSFGVAMVQKDILPKIKTRIGV
jgi:hypothetical protein